MTMEGSETAGCSRVPELDEMVFGPSNYKAFGWMPGNGFNIPAVPGEGSLFHAFVKVPDLDRSVV